MKLALNIILLGRSNFAQTDLKSLQITKLYAAFQCLSLLDYFATLRHLCVYFVLRVLWLLLLLYATDNNAIQLVECG